MIGIILSKEKNLLLITLFVFGISFLIGTIGKSVNYDFNMIKEIFSSFYSFKTYILDFIYKVSRADNGISFIKENLLAEVGVSLFISIAFYSLVGSYYNQYNALIKSIPSLNNFDFIKKRGKDIYLLPINKEVTIDLQAMQQDKMNIEKILDIKNVEIKTNKRYLIIGIRNNTRRAKR